MVRARHLLQEQRWCLLALPGRFFSPIATCHFDEVGSDFATAIFERLVELNTESSQFAMNWAHYLLSDADVNTQIWHWSSHHPKLSHQIAEGTGIMITLPQGDQIEIQWNKKFEQSFFTEDISYAHLG